MDSFGFIAIAAIFVVGGIIAIICAIVYSIIYGPVREWLRRDDARHIVQAHLSELKGWRPQGHQLEKFIREQLGGKGFVRGTKQHYSGQTLQDFLCRIISFKQPESSLVVAQAEKGGKLCTIIYMRFWWENQWWALWYGPKKRGHKPQFRAFPETWVEDEAWTEVGRIKEFHTISYETLSRYF